MAVVIGDEISVPTGMTPPNINPLVAIVISAMSPPIRVKHGKFDALTMSNGLPVGSAVTIVGRVAALFPGVTVTGPTVGPVTASVAEPAD